MAFVRATKCNEMQLFRGGCFVLVYFKQNRESAVITGVNAEIAIGFC